MTKGQVELEQLSVNPCFLEIADIDELRDVGACVDILPSYYNVVLRVSPLVIQKLLKWLLSHHYVKLSGTLTVSIRGRVYKYVQ